MTTLELIFKELIRIPLRAKKPSSQLGTSERRFIINDGCSRLVACADLPQCTVVVRMIYRKNFTQMKSELPAVSGRLCPFSFDSANNYFER